MSDVHSALHFMWALVFAGLGVFFLVAGGRFRERGYRVLSIVMACTALTGLLYGVADEWEPGGWNLVLSRIALFFCLLAGAANVDFLITYCKQRSLAWVARTSYLSALFAGVATIVGTLASLSSTRTLTDPSFGTPSAAFAWLAFGVIALFHLIYIAVLVRACRHDEQGACAVLVVVMMLAPATMTDTYFGLFRNQRWFLAETGTWLYALVVLGSLLWEVEGKEGLLRKTTWSLAERTAELEISYAEIDLMQTELTRKQQLAAVGELAASIAHEVRNPLAIIMNAVSGMKRATISKKDQETLLSIVNEEAERLNHLVTELLRFARPVTASRGPASLFDICQQASQQPPEGYTVSVSTESGDELGLILVDPGLFRLALDNLIANSSQAMKDGGTIELSVRRGAFTDGTPAAIVDVADHGCGMEAQELEKARKPFFTTKPRGTGLGLPIVDRIVEAHGGEMELRSELGRGTRVSIKLPVEHEKAPSSGFPGSKHPASRRRRRSLPSTLSGIGPASKELT